MKKTLSAIALAAVMFVAMSGFDKSGIGVEVGDQAPRLALANDASSITLDDYRGRYVLVTFWTVADAASRVRNNQFDAWTSQNADRGVAHLSINLDDNQALAAEVAKVDKTDQNVQFNVAGQEAKKIARDFRLADGVNSLLIGPDGRVCEVNPEVSILASL